MKYLFTHSVTMIRDTREDALKHSRLACGGDDRIVEYLEKQNLYHCEETDSDGNYLLRTYSIKPAGEIYGDA